VKDKVTQCSMFVDDTMFSYNGVNGPESKTMRMFHQTMSFGPVSQVAALGAKSAISDCILFSTCQLI